MTMKNGCPLGCNDMRSGKIVETLQSNQRLPSLVGRGVGVYSETSVHLYKMAQLQHHIPEDNDLQAPKNTDSASPRKYVTFVTIR